MPANTRKLLRVLMRIGALILCLVLLFALVDVPTAVRQLLHLAPWCVLAVASLAMFRHFLTSLRWRLLNPDPSGQWQVFDYFRYTMISNVFNLVMPGALGGDLIRSLYIVKEAEGHKTTNIMGILVDRVVGLFSILLLGTLCGALSPVMEQRSLFMVTMVGLLCAGVVGAALALHKPLNTWLVQLIEPRGKIGKALAGLLKTWSGVTDFYKENHLRVFMALVYCFMIHGIWFLAVYILARNLGVEIGFLNLSMFTAISWLITAIPLTFGGLGVRELSFVVLLGSQGIGAEQATALSLAQFAIGLILAVVALPIILMGRSSGSTSPKD